MNPAVSFKQFGIINKVILDARAANLVKDNTVIVDLAKNSSTINQVDRRCYLFATFLIVSICATLLSLQMTGKLNILESNKNLGIIITGSGSAFLLLTVAIAYVCASKKAESQEPQMAVSELPTDSEVNVQKESEITASELLAYIEKNPEMFTILAIENLTLDGLADFISFLEEKFRDDSDNPTFKNICSHIVFTVNTAIPGTSYTHKEKPCKGTKWETIKNHILEKKSCPSNFLEIIFNKAEFPYNIDF